MLRIIKYSLIAIIFFNGLMGFDNESDVDNLYLYDVSMLPESDPFILKCPEIIIYFNKPKLKNLKPGDKLYVRLKSSLEQTKAPYWYYPPHHNKNISFMKKIKNKSIETRINKLSLFGKEIPYPSIRFMSDDILGSARTKVKPAIDWPNDLNPKFRIIVEESIDSQEFIRLRGLYFFIRKPGEVGPTIIEYCVNQSGKDDNWQRLGSYRFIIGQSIIKDIHPKRFLRIEDNKYPLTLDIETGQYPTISKGESLRIILSEGVDAEWTGTKNQKITIRDGSKSVSSTVPVAVNNKIFSLSFPEEIQSNSHLIIGPMIIKSTKGPINQLTSGSVTIETDLTGNFDAVSKKKSTQLGSKMDGMLLMHPTMDILQEDLLFYRNSDTIPNISIKIGIEPGSYLTKADTLKIVIPNNVNLEWGKILPKYPKSNMQLSYSDPKTLELRPLDRIEKSILIESIPFMIPTTSILPFELKANYSFAPDTLFIPIPGYISFGQAQIGMSKPKLINRLQGRAILNDIVITEDKTVSTLKKNNIIKIIGNADYFEFDKNRLVEILFNNVGRDIETEKIKVNYNRSMVDTIVLTVDSDFEPGDIIRIKNIPIIVDTTKRKGSYNLKYNLNDKSLLIDASYINIIDVSIDMVSQVDFIRDLNNPRKSFTLPDAQIKFSGHGKTINTGEQFILSMPENTGSWVGEDQIKTGNVAINKKSDRELLLTVRDALYNEDDIYIRNLTLRPHQGIDEFDNEKLKLRMVSDTSIFISSTKQITYSYPSISSLDEQDFFTDDTSWALYNFSINTRNLDYTIYPGSKISIVFSDPKVRWDKNYKTVNVIGEYTDLILPEVVFNDQNCHIVAADTIRANMDFEISGLRIRSIDTHDMDFFLKMSLNGGKTICAMDNLKKSVRKDTDYTEKFNRSLKEKNYSLKTNRRLKIQIPAGVPYEWDTTAQDITEALITEGPARGKPKGSITLECISKKATFLGKKTVELKIIQGNDDPPESSGLGLSGFDQSQKNFIFKGLKLKALPSIQAMDSDYHLDLIVETPYGERKIKSNRPDDDDFGLKINGKKFIRQSLISDKPMEISVSTSSVKKTTRLLKIYAQEIELLYKPLVDEFGFGNDKDRVINTIKYINDLYGDTDPPGNNWRVWYYLAWAKYRAERLKILDKVRISKYLNKRILKQDYQNDMEEAKKKGYQPQGRHSAFPTIERGDLAAGILNRIEAAKGKFSKGNVIAAEEDFLAIKDDTEKNEDLEYLSVHPYYWLGRIGIKLGDFENIVYKKGKSSDPYKKFIIALRRFKRNEPKYPDGEMIGDSIIFYQKKLLVLYNQQFSDPMPPQRFGERTSKEFTKHSYRFSYAYDDNYTYNINGNTIIDQIKLVNPDNNASLKISDKLNPTFDDEMQLGKGGEYNVSFSPGHESIINILTSSLVIGMISLFYE